MSLYNRLFGQNAFVQDRLEDGTIVESPLKLFLEKDILLINSYNTVFMINKTKRKAKVVKQPISDAATRIKVQLDHKTMMVVHSMAAFKMWKKRYPLAKVIV